MWLCTRILMSESSICSFAEDSLGGDETLTARDEADGDETRPSLGNTERHSFDLSAEEEDSTAYLPKGLSLGMAVIVMTLKM